MNYLRPDKDGSGLVFQALEDGELQYSGSMTMPFDPRALRVDPATGYLFHPSPLPPRTRRRQDAPSRYGPYSLLRSSLVIEHFAKSLELEEEEGGGGTFEYAGEQHRIEPLQGGDVWRRREDVSPLMDDQAPQQRPQKRQRRAPLPAASDLFVPRLPGLPDGAQLSLFGGLLPSTPPTSLTSDAQHYFLLARNKHIPKRERLVIWLNGGPGCSSFDGALIELGPIKVNKDGATLRLVESTAWNEYANVLFLDQPAGTGFSYVTKDDDVRELAAAAEQVVHFLANFYKVFPEFSYMDTFIAGESYAGQYIPYIADAIEKTMLLPTRLKGLLIGNGWISPREQYPAYLTYLEREGLLKKGTQAHRNVLAATQKCNATLAAMDAKNGAEGSKGMVLVPDCEAILGAMSAATMKDGKCLNSYDTREYFACGTQWPHELTEVTKYLRRDDVIKALHAESVPHKWTHCSQSVASKFWTPNSAPAVALLPDLLEKMPILLYAGDKDLMCAGVGIEAAIARLEWNGAKGFGDAEVLEWSVGEEEAGRWTTARNLTYVEFTNSSHMVPLDKPLAAHDMLLRFMQVDTLHSAGSAARIPSRVGAQPATVLGATHPNGSTLVDSSGDVLLSSPDAALLLPGGGEGDTPPEQQGRQKELSDEGYDIAHERFYGPRRTAALVVLLVLLAGADDDESDDAVEGNEARQRRRDDPEAWGDLGRTPEPQPGFEAWSDSRRGRG
ncbi:Alpha/Beta hydrolase protein [Rhodotorula diobovata]|uniref:Carboxypeptidase n=1 Tax=Rhodotorula diobovata TaxID=5288 RepID=A0A5C5FS98_9BASI|nr:Alpha/Beta hydrolase protein [Rhodotorula diobovata]